MLTEKRKAYLAEWRTKNRDKTREAQKRYYKANSEKCNAAVVASVKKKREYYNAKMRDWRRQNHEVHLEYRRLYYANNSAKEIERVRRRMGRIKQALNNISQAEQAEIQGLYEFCRIFNGFEVDHIIPLNGKTVSGLHVLSNLRVLPVSENRSKSNKLIYL